MDGSGKSIHSAWYVNRLREYGFKVLSTREPGGCDLSNALRELLLQHNMDVSTELLMVFASRNEHICKTIRPALNEGVWVVCERFVDSTYAYQGAGRGCDHHRIAFLEDWICAGIKPVRTYFLKTPQILARKRIAERGGQKDRFEQEDADFFDRVNLCFENLFLQNPERCRIINATLSINAIHDILEEDIYYFAQSTL